MNNATTFGILFGFFLAVGAMWQGLGGFLLVLVLCGVGALLGAHLEGKLDLRNLPNLTSGLSGRGRG